MEKILVENANLVADGAGHATNVLASERGRRAASGIAVGGGSVAKGLAVGRGSACAWSSQGWR